MKNKELVLTLLGLLQEEKPVAQKQDNTSLPWIAPGVKVFIRTVTVYITGVVYTVTPDEIVLKDASWVADTGRFSEFLKTGNASEVEQIPLPHWVVRWSSVVDYGLVPDFTLPLETK